MTDSFDVIVIGGGPAGYVAAIRCAQLGLKTACIDQWTNESGKASLGGTCLNVGCIPSKALLDSSKHYHHLNTHYKQHGISAKDVSMDVSTMVARKDKIVKQLTGGIAQLFKSNKVTSINGHGKLLSASSVEVSPIDGDAYTIAGKHVILASGSIPTEIPSFPFDHEYIVDNAGALAFKETPKRLGVIGAGVIGLELGSVWKRLGSEVILLEALPEFLAAADADVTRVAQREFKKQGLDIRLNTRVNKAEVVGKHVNISVTDKTGDHLIEVDRLLVCVGRRAYTENLLSDGCGVKLTQQGQIEVDDHCQTSLANVWAIGDCVRGPMLAHKGSEEGVAVAETIAGGQGHIDFNTVPWVIYTEPEIAWVGKTEQQLKQDGVDYKAGNFPFAATGRAMAMMETSGMVKILADAKTDEVLGVHICGANASELIAEAVVTMEFQGSSEDLARIVHAHPTLSEAVHEAALAVDKRAIHKAN